MLKEFYVLPAYRGSAAAVKLLIAFLPGTTLDRIAEYEFVRRLHSKLKNTARSKGTMREYERCRNHY
jgi:hypothetical protein